MLRAIEGLVVAQRLSLTAIGRAVRGQLQPRHGIKMMDRLIGNPKVQAERRRWYSALAHSLVGSENRVLVLLDWTQLHGEWWALVGAIAFADGGFRSPFFEACSDAGVRFVIRLRNERGMARIAERRWERFQFGEIFSWARTKVRCLGQVIPFCMSSHRHECHVVLGPAPSAFGKRARYADSCSLRPSPW